MFRKNRFFISSCHPPSLSVGNKIDTILSRMEQSNKKTKNPASYQKPSLRKNHPDSWEKIKFLLEEEEAKEDLINIQEEIENAFLESVDFNWQQMSPTEKKLAIQLGCLVKNLRKNLENNFKLKRH